MDLLDREAELQQLRIALGRVSGGQGEVVALLGEAGIGKSSLVKAFLDEAEPGVRVLRGFCDDLGIAEPLGVLRDLAREADAGLPDGIVAAGERLNAFSIALDSFSDPGLPTVVVVEDVHWADEATVDFLRFLTRRIARHRTMVLLTARTDEASGRNNVRRIIGDAVSGVARRIHLGPLSRESVNSLAAEAGRDPGQVYEITAGNAFFVTELLNGQAGVQSDTVQDAVLARADRLDRPARAVLEAVAIFPRPAATSLVSKLLGRDIADALDACLDNGLLIMEETSVAFRHVLARHAVLSEIRAARRMELNGRLLGILEERGDAGPSRLLHHAREAGMGDAVRRLSARAAEEAARLGAHREAAEYYRVAVEALGADASADLLEDAAYASYLVGVDSDAIEYQNRALDIHSRNRDRLRVGDGLRRRSRFHWSLGAFGQARTDARAAVRELSDLHGPELAMAHSNIAQIFMLNREYHLVREPAEVAIQIAEEFGRPDILSHALNNLACALQFSDPDRARRDMARSLDLALDIGHVDHSARAFVNATYIEMYLCRFDLAKSFATKGIDYCGEQELDGYWAYLMGALALAELGLGELDAAGRHAQAALGRANGFDVGLYRHSGSIARLRHQVRTGMALDAGEIGYLDTFRSSDTELQRLIPYAECMAEHAWMTGEDTANAVELLTASIDWAPIPEVAQTAHLWLSRLESGHEPPGFDGFLDCHRLEMEGDIVGADAAWAERAAPYERALCLAQGDRGQRQRAAALFEQLGATAAARRVRSTLSRTGAPSASRPRESTLRNPAGLTKRQMDVLRCLQDGLSNADIAERLFVAPKTVDHHVSAILAKLGVHSRAEAAAKASRGELE